MFRTDYILRMIEQATSVLVVVLGLRRAQRPAEALAAIDRLLREQWGLDLGMLGTLDPDSVVRLVATEAAVDLGKCLVLAELLQAEGEIRAELGQTAEREDRDLKALALLLEAAHASDDTALPALEPRLAPLLERLADAVFPDAVNHRLADYYDRLAPPAADAPLEL